MDQLPPDPGTLPGVHIDFTDRTSVYAVLEGGRIRVLNLFGTELEVANGVYDELLDDWKVSSYLGVPPVHVQNRLEALAAKVGRKVVRLRPLVVVWSVLSE